MVDEPEEERKTEAEEEAGDDREVDRGVFATMNDVAGESSQAEREFAAEVQKSAQTDKEPTENEESPAEFAERVHPGILPETVREAFPAKNFC